MPKKYMFGALAVFVAGVSVAGFDLVAVTKPAAAPAPIPVAEAADEATRAIWRTTPVEKLFPAAITRDTVDAPANQYVRLGIAGPAGCDILPQQFRAALTSAAPATQCLKVLRATYTDSTRTVLVTVGIVVIDGTAAARDKVWRGWTPDSDSKTPAMMPDVFPVPGTSAATFANGQRVVWNSNPTNDGTFLTYTVAGFGDGRAGSSDAQLISGAGRALAADSPPVQASDDLVPDFVRELTDLEKGGTSS